MRNMSFALTTKQILDGSKTVTRRVGWDFLQPGDVVQAIEKGQGLKKGEHVKKLAVIKVESVTGEWMSCFRERPDAQAECVREGFPEMSPQDFYAFFRGSHADLSADDLRVQRIEFSFVDALGKEAAK